MLKIFYWLFSMKVAMCNCHSEIRKSGFSKGKSQYIITKVGKLPPKIHESSGLARTEKGTFWTHNDGGNPTELYEINEKGEVLSTLALPNLPNYDWEDLAQDQAQNLYLADIGNNFNNRQNLRIFKFKSSEPQRVDTIAFRYADQTAFPAQIQNFDSEAAVFQENKLYVFSKNRSLTHRFVKMYAIPAEAGHYTVAPKDSIFIKSMITGADISPDNRTLALLSYGKVFLFDISSGMNLKKPLSCIKIGKAQAEAIVFVNNTDFIFTNEYHREIYLGKRK